MQVSHPVGGHHVWVRMNGALDERSLFTEALRHQVGFTPGAAAMPELPARASRRLSFSLLEPEALDEGMRRLAMAIRAARRLQRAPSVAVS